jgi:DNA-binding NtrC family response regulator
MTVARRDVRGVQGEPSAALFRLHRGPLPNLFVIGGTAADRVAIAGALHRDSRLRGRPFCVTGAGAYEGLLRTSLRIWAGPTPTTAPLACGGGTLFVDQIALLPRDLQELLVPLATRLAAETGEPAPTAGPARLAAGCREDPVLHVSAGRLLPALYETLDKLVIQLGTAPAMTAIA